MKLATDDFEKLALDQLDTLYRVARRLTRQNSEAEDLVQETYLRALKARESFNLQEFGIRPWLMRIMHNLHINRSQREKRQPVAVEDEHLDATGDGSDGVPLDPKSFEGMDQQLVRALETLAPEYRMVLLLWAVEDLSYKEIAHVIDIPIGTVMSRLHRARKQLSDQLRDYAVQERLIRE